MKEQTCALCNKKKEQAELIFKAHGKAGNIICKKCVKTCNTLLKQHERKRINGKNWKNIKSNFTPTKIAAQLAKKVAGHENFVHRLSVIAYKLLNRIYQAGDVDDDQKPLTMLTIGSTGSGKTHTYIQLAKLLAKQGIPFAQMSCAVMSSTGYVGPSVNDVLRSLAIEHQKMHGTNQGSVFGVVICDEADKMAGSSSATMDVSGKGVQRELLATLDGANVEVQTSSQELFYSSNKKTIVDTRNVLFLFCGAFEGLDEHYDNQQSMDKFGKYKPPSLRKANKKLNAGRLIHGLKNFGMLGELMGRMNIIFRLNELTPDNLAEIARKFVLEKIQKDFAAERINLEWSDDVIPRLVEIAQDRKTGARGINAAVIETLQLPAYELLGHTNTSPVTVKLLPCEKLFLKTQIIN